MFEQAQAKIEELEARIARVEANPSSGPALDLEAVRVQQNVIYQVLKLILQGRFTGDMPHAEAFAKSLNPSDSNWSAVEFPKE